MFCYYIIIISLFFICRKNSQFGCKNSLGSGTSQFYCQSSLGNPHAPPAWHHHLSSHMAKGRDLLQHGLLTADFIPNRAQRELRELVGCRKSLVQDKNRELNRLQKMLEGANIKLSGTITDTNGKSARNILGVLVQGGTIDSEKYDGMRREKAISSRLKASKEEILDDLSGVMSQLHRKMMRVLLSHADEPNRYIKELDDQIDDHMKPDEKRAAEAISGGTGLEPVSSRIVISVIGTDMSRFPTDGHLCSWAGLCPGDNESAKKRKSWKTRKGNKLLRTTRRAYVAASHSLLIAIYHILNDGVEFKDLGADYYNQFNKERKINAYLKKLKVLGWEAPGAMAGQPA